VSLIPDSGVTVNDREKFIGVIATTAAAGMTATNSRSNNVLDVGRPSLFKPKSFYVQSVYVFGVYLLQGIRGCS
jgi:hypothetical protein